MTKQEKLKLLCKKKRLELKRLQMIDDIGRRFMYGIMGIMFLFKLLVH